MDSYPQALPHGFRLQGSTNTYTIDRVLGQGSFGITYLTRMHHTGIVNVIKVVEANHTAYIVMEYVDGGSLNDHIAQRGRLPAGVTGRTRTSWTHSATTGHPRSVHRTPTAHAICSSSTAATTRLTTAAGTARVFARSQNDCARRTQCQIQI